MRPRLLILSLVSLPLLFAAGCGAPVPVQPSGSADEAKTLLTQALDAWQSGTAADDMKAHDPAMIVADEDWSAGRKLKKHEIPDAGVQNGGHWRIPVLLTLEGRKPVRVFYAVTPGNPASIIRSDFSE